MPSIGGVMLQHENDLSTLHQPYSLSLDGFHTAGGWIVLGVQGSRSRQNTVLNTVP